MNQKPRGRTSSSEPIIRDIKRKTRKQYGAEEKIRIVLDVMPLLFLAACASDSNNIETSEIIDNLTPGYVKGAGTGSHFLEERYTGIVKTYTVRASRMFMK